MEPAERAGTGLELDVQDVVSFGRQVIVTEAAALTALAATLPGLLAFAGARRWGTAGLIGALCLCAVVAVLVLTPAQGAGVDPMPSRDASPLLFVVLPGMLSLLLGALLGFRTAERREIDDRLP